MTANYWERVTRNRLTRRRALLAAGGIGVTGASLALLGCGSDDDGEGASGAGGGTGASNGLLSTPKDTTGQAKAGGTIRDFQNADMLNFDPVASPSNPVINFVAVFAYPRLLKFKPGKYPDPSDGSSEGETATSWEMSGDRLTLTFKLREGMKWDSRAPTNGREIDAEDVIFSWNKYRQLNASAADLAYDATKAPGAPIESLSAPDKRTVVMKLKQFDSSLLQLLTAWDHFYIMPRESDGGFDPKTEIRGHGPWLLEEYVPSAKVVWKKNPDYYVSGRPFPDRLERPIVVDYAQRLAQFKAGNIWTNLPTLAEDVVQTKRDAPGSVIHKAPTFETTVSPFITFGWDGESPFKDVRMRRALAMLIDNEAFADVVENRAGFARDGLEPEIARNTIIAPGQTGYYIDPTDTGKFSENGKFLQYNAEEAKKLMAAAGHGNGTSFNVYYNTENTYGAIYHQILDIYEGMFGAGGMTLKREGSPYAFYREQIYDFYLQRNYANRGDKGLNGIVHKALRGFPTVAAGLFGMMHSDGGFYQGVSPTGMNVERGDSQLNAMIDKIKREPDRGNQQKLVQDAVKYITGQMYNVPRPTMAKLFTNWWPAIGNVDAYSTYAGGNIWVEERLNWWVDSTKAPLT
jgi:peptide/nickel transport system substrate-binding protein